MKRKLQAFLKNSLQASLQKYFAALPAINIIQIGANDGETLDPVNPLLEKYTCRALLVEPQPVVFEKLAEKYKHRSQITCMKKAVTATTQHEQLPFYHIAEKNGYPFNPDFSLWGSFNEEHLEKFRKIIPHFDELKTVSYVETISINDLLAQSGFQKVHYLQVDVEGYDEVLINAIDYRQHRPALIRFEHVHANRKSVFVLLQKLNQLNYQTYSLGMDTMAVDKEYQKYFRTLALVKKLHKNWLTPAKSN